MLLGAKQLLHPRWLTRVCTWSPLPFPPPPIIFVGHSPRGGVCGACRLYVTNSQQRVQAQRTSTVMLHHSSSLIHQYGLEDGVKQREMFAELATLPGMLLHAAPYGRINSAAAYSDIARVLNDSNTHAVPRMLLIELPQRMNANAAMTFEDLRQVAAAAASAPNLGGRRCVLLRSGGACCPLPCQPTLSPLRSLLA